MTADYNPTMLNQDCSRKLFNWFLARVDILTRLRKATRAAAELARAADAGGKEGKP